MTIFSCHVSGSSDCVKLLIAMDACLEAYDIYYGTPLHVACSKEHMDCVKVLLNAGERQCKDGMGKLVLSVYIGWDLNGMRWLPSLGVWIPVGCHLRTC